MSLSPDNVETNENNTEDLNNLLQIPKKKSARRSLESQFETCLQGQVEQNNEDDREPKETNSSVSSQEGLQETETSHNNLNCDVVNSNLTVSTRLFKNQQICPASSTESIASSVNSRRRARSPSRTPSFCAAVSASLISIDEEVRKKDAEVTLSGSCKTKIKSKTSATPKSITSLPPSPHHVPNQTSTPAPNQVVTISSSHTNTIDSDAALCRICHDGDSCEELVSPCHCSGSVGALHMTCLETWLGASNTTKCEICKYEFKVERKPRPLTEMPQIEDRFANKPYLACLHIKHCPVCHSCKHKRCSNCGFRMCSDFNTGNSVVCSGKFLRHPTSQADRKNLVCDLVCFTVLTPLTACSAFLCLMGAKHYSQWAGSKWEVVGLASLTACLLTIFTAWCCVATKHHIDVLIDWRKKNQIIKIIYLSPTKGRTVLRTQTVKDSNNNYVTQSPSRTLGCRTLGTCTPSALTSLCGAVHARDTSSRSYNAAMLRPILRYSVNLQTYSHPSGLDSPASLSHTILWGQEQSDFGSNPLLFSHGGSSQMMSVVGKETYV